MKIKIPFLSWTGKADLEVEIPQGTEKRLRLRVALEVSVKARAHLSRADLSRAHLSGADLSGADLSGAHLSGADLSGADLSGAHLFGAYLSGADLSRAHLSGAYLSRADLSRADLGGAHLSGADLSGADLSGAHLSGAHLSGADLSGADLSGADLSRADLSRADLGGGQKATIPPLFILGQRWPVMITDRHIKIGCEVHTTDKWEAFREYGIAKFDKKSESSWATWWETILKVARVHQAEVAKAARGKPKTEAAA